MFKERLVFILVPIASAPISSSIVDQHRVATTDDEPIEDVDPITLNVDLVALDVVMDIPLRRSKRHLQEHEYDVGDVSDPTTYKEALVCPQSNF